MRILWITNTIFPFPSNKLGLSTPVVGGWMYGLAKEIAAIKGIQLAVATVYAGDKIKKFKDESIIYYLLPNKGRKAYKKELEPLWGKLCEEFTPELIHIHGTEFSHGLACMRAYPNLNYVVSIQGLVSVCARYYLAGISALDIFRTITFRDLLRVDTIFNARNKFVRRGKLEKEYLQRTKHIIGRTTWDYSHVKQINSNVTYHFNNEILRDKFYESPKWNYESKIDYSIFLSQASYPLKGLHQVLKAMAILRGDFPDINLRVAGDNIVKADTLRTRLKLTGYGAYILKLLKQLNLEKCVTFTGALNEAEMISEYRNAHIFVCPSSLENSPNSLGEAQLLGVPSISAFVGGAPDMVIHGETGFLYRFEEVEMLAHYIRTLFSNKLLALKISKNGIRSAERRHDRSLSISKNIDIYKSIIAT